jgi:hypothetical protein
MVNFDAHNLGMKASRKRSHDPRTHVTPDAFSVAEELIGRPLAAPWRRAAALLIDLVLIFALTKTGGFAFSVLVSLTAFWLIVRGAKGWKSAFIRGSAALPAGVIVLVVCLALFWDGPDYGPNAAELARFSEAMGSEDPRIREAAVLELQAAFEEQPGELDDGEAGAIFGDDAPEPGSAEEARRQAVREYARVSQENQVLRSQLEEPSLKYLAQALANDLGLSIGWTGLYFTLFPAFWRGRTPGKFLFRLRVVRLDLSPIRPWTAFERFAGYAAGVATGLLGFVQIFWDANRQGVQDKIVGTVVIREPER